MGTPSQKKKKEWSTSCRLSILNWHFRVTHPLAPFFVPDQRPTVNSLVCLTTVGAKANVLLYVG